MRENKSNIHKRRKMREIILLLIIIISSSTAHAFTFDVWESSMDIDTIIMTAMKNDIPLAKDGWLGNPKHFDKKLCVPYRKTAIAYQYFAELLGKNAKVTLHLTKEKKRLMKVSILWGQGQSE
ncbi:MAG: hypothetical protein D3903_05325 [Candidatus Electrothrix sp. GM3_4]|nr:hypothetical protein [Candidatus Electrothrix sp. GM3_4]